MFPPEPRFYGKTAVKRFQLSKDRSTKFVGVGKEQGYLNDEMDDDPIPQGLHSSDNLDDVFGAIGTRGIEVLDGRPELRFSSFPKELNVGMEGSREVDFDSGGGAPEKTDDLVRIYSGATTSASSAN